MLRQPDGTLARVELERRARPRRAAASRHIIERHGPDAVAFYLSGQLLTEDYYVANKLMKGFIGSANVDTNSRLCMASSVAGHRRAFGADTVPGTYADLDEADLIVLVGSNAAWCHPVLFQRMVQQQDRARRQDRRDRSAPHRDRRRRRPVPADRARHGHRAVLRPAGASRRARRARPRATSLRTPPASTTRSRARATIAPDIDGDRARDRARRRATSRALLRAVPHAPQRVVTCYSQGVNQSAQGTDKVNAIINCHLATGRIGKPGCGPFSLTGQPNAMGGREVGGLANMLAAHMGFSPAEVDRVRPLLERAAHGRARGPQGGADVRGDRARRDQGAVGDGDQSGGVAAARGRGARGARQARAVRRVRERPLERHRECRRACPAAGRGLGREGRHRHQFRAPHLAPARLPAAAGRSQARLVDRLARSRGGSASPTRSPIARRPTSSASTPRCRPSRTTARATSTSAASPTISDDDYDALAPVQWPLRAGDDAPASGASSPTAASSRPTARAASSRRSRPR